MLIEDKISSIHRIAATMALTNKVQFQKVCKALEAMAPLTALSEEKEIRFDRLEEEVLKVLALHHPVASDLKHTLQLFKVGQDLDSIAVYIHKVYRKVTKLIENGPFALPDLFLIQLRTVETIISEVYLVIKAGKPSHEQLDYFKVQERLVHDWRKKFAEDMADAVTEGGANAKQIVLLQGLTRNLDRMAKIVVHAAEDIAEV